MTPAPRSCFLMLFSNKRNSDSLERWLILQPEQGVYEMAGAFLYCQKVRSAPQKNGSISKGHRSQLKGTQLLHLKQSEQQNK